jgi:hypothetical protein
MRSKPAVNDPETSSGSVSAIPVGNKANVYSFRSLTGMATSGEGTNQSLATQLITSSSTALITNRPYDVKAMEHGQP